MALQSDGKIVAVGTTGAGDNDFALARYNPNGSLDTSFSGDGKQTTDFGGADRSANGVAIQGDGKIVAVASAPAGADFALARYNPNGSLDTSFSGDGKQTTDFGGVDRLCERGGAPGRRQDRRRRQSGVGDNGRLRARPLQPERLARHELLRRRQADDRLRGRRRGERGGAPGDGKIVAVGDLPAAAVSDFALARYNPNGSLDTSFSGDGKQTTDFGGFEHADGVALQGDGKIVAVGAAAASRSPATTPTARSTRASPATAS